MTLCCFKPFAQAASENVRTPSFPVLSAETPFSWGLHAGFRHDPGAVWPPGPVEEEWSEEGSPSFLDCLERSPSTVKPTHLKYLYMHRHDTPYFAAVKRHLPVTPGTFSQCWGSIYSFLYAMWSECLTDEPAEEDKELHLHGLVDAPCLPCGFCTLLLSHPSWRFHTTWQ